MQISFKRLAASFLFGALLLATPLYVFPKLPKNQSHFQVPEFKGVLSLWHADTFEGGSLSRLEFLKGRAMEFEKQNKGMFVSVQSFTFEQIKDKLADGEAFDLISFGAGIGEQLRSLLGVYGGAVNVRGDLLESGKLDGKILALPWTYGGYMLAAYQDNLAAEKILTGENVFTHAKKKRIGKNDRQMYSLGTGFGAFNNPFAVLEANGVKISGEFDFGGDFEATQYEAYENYLTGDNFSVLLGTQRDLSRFVVRENNGKLKPCQFVFLGGYTDLVQYVGYFPSDRVKKQICEGFMEYLTSDTVQRRLSKIEMFSVADKNIFTQGLHKEMEAALSEKLIVPNAFTDGHLLKAARKESFGNL